MIVLNVRWSLRFALDYRELEEMIIVRGLKVDSKTINRWLLERSPELDYSIRRHTRLATAWYRIDETYIKVKIEWKNLYKAVDSDGLTIDSMLSAERDGPLPNLSSAK
jgi:transposase-like protein